MLGDLRANARDVLFQSAKKMRDFEREFRRDRRFGLLHLRRDAADNADGEAKVARDLRALFRRA